ncbi:MAG: hypothetical protein KGL39_57150, partial [Patescibacteria group bacterium]|nr:hypothetical protein [Patescibacteria group bacterium]
IRCRTGEVMPNRIIRDGVLTSERVNALSERAELFYRRLMSVVDDFGRFSANPMLLRASCYPLRLDSVKDRDISGWLSECFEAGLLGFYEASGSKYLELLNFKQRTRQAKSKCPSIDGQLTVKCPSIAHGDGDGDGDGDDNPRKRASADADLFPDVPEQVVRDFKAIRRTKKAAITPTAMAGIVREAEKAGMTLAAALAVCCERGWAGFKAEWVTRDAGSGQPTPAGTPRKRRMLS